MLDFPERFDDAPGIVPLDNTVASQPVSSPMRNVSLSVPTARALPNLFSGQLDTICGRTSFFVVFGHAKAQSIRVGIGEPSRFVSGQFAEGRVIEFYLGYSASG